MAEEQKTPEHIDEKTSSVPAPPTSTDQPDEETKESESPPTEEEAKDGRVPNDPNFWPQQQTVPDGVIPTSEVSQDPNLYKDSTDEDLIREMD